MKDPIVAEVRRFRDEHARAFGYDLDAICNDLASKHSFYIDKLRNTKQAEKRGPVAEEAARIDS